MVTRLNAPRRLPTGKPPASADAPQHNKASNNTPATPYQLCSLAVGCNRKTPCTTQPAKDRLSARWKLAPCACAQRVNTAADTGGPFIGGQYRTKVHYFCTVSSRELGITA